MEQYLNFFMESSEAAETKVLKVEGKAASIEMEAHKAEVWAFEAE